MDFSKITAQREAKQSVTLNEETDQMLARSIARVPEVAAMRDKPGPKPKATSKRNDPETWRAATMYLQVETKARLERYLNLAKLDSRTDQQHPGDQSELMDLALREWLDQRMPALEAEVIGR